MKKILSISVFLFLAIGAKAQWSAGISAGWDYNWPSINKGYATDVTYRGQGGFDVSATGRYSFADWFAVRADLRLDSRNYKMERNYSRFKDIYTMHRDLYLHLPVVADFSFGGERLRGHCYLGAYAGLWLSARRYGNAIQNSSLTNEIAVQGFDEKMEFDSRRDNRFNAGLTGGAGLSFKVTPEWEIIADALLMYDLTTSNKLYRVANPRYNSTMCVNLGVMYNF